MSFFDVPAPDEDDLDPAEEAGIERPGRWLGGGVALEAFVGRSDEAAVAVRRLIVFTDGFELDVVAWVRRPRRRRRGRFHREILLSPRGPYGPRDDDGNLVPELVRIGVQFPNGAKATNLDDRWAPSPDATEPAHGMSSTRGVGLGRGSRSDLLGLAHPRGGRRDPGLRVATLRDRRIPAHPGRRRAPGGGGPGPTGVARRAATLPPLAGTPGSVGRARRERTAAEPAGAPRDPETAGPD